MMENKFVYIHQNDTAKFDKLRASSCPTISVLEMVVYLFVI